MLQDYNDGRYSVVEHFGCPEQTIKEYREHFGQCDVIFSQTYTVTSGRHPAFTRIDSNAAAALLLFLQRFMRPHDMLYQCGIVLERVGNRLSTLTALRNHTAEPFGDNEYQLLQTLNSHLRCASALHRTVAPLQRGNELLEAAFACDPWPMFIVDASMRVLRVNKAGENLVRASSCIRIEAEHLELSAPESQEQLKYGYAVHVI
jgi:PAS domain-containing protein